MPDVIPQNDFSAIVILIVKTIIVMMLLLIVKHFIDSYINRTVSHVEQRHHIRGWARVTIYLLIAVLIITVWLPSGQSAMQLLALFAAALTVTLSRPIMSLLAWVVMVFHGPFAVGDRIQVGDISGDVVDISLLHTHLLETGNWIDADQSTGRLVHLPNRFIFEEALFNATEDADLIWNELHFVVTHHSDWERARDLILAEAQPIYDAVEPLIDQSTDKISEHYAYRRGITTPFVYVKLLRDGIKLTLRYLCQVRKRRGSTHHITIGVLRAIRSEANIKLAAPGYRIVMEGQRKEVA